MHATAKISSEASIQTGTAQQRSGTKHPLAAGQQLLLVVGLGHRYEPARIPPRR
ncbi:MAG: hypothetical protein ABR500_10595 [Dermatophilaceae bacterium]